MSFNQTEDPLSPIGIQYPTIRASPSSATDPVLFSLPDSAPLPGNSADSSEDIEIDDDASSESSDRPIRSQGSINKWRRSTLSERSLAASLEQLEDEDLAIHLYNAHSLKRRLYAPDDDHTPRSGSDDERPRKRKIEQWHRKERWMTILDENGDKTWYPKSSWTAWPLEPETVPRPDERLSRSWKGDVEEETWTVKSKMQGNWKPSMELEDILLGETLRTARERFALREYDHETRDQTRRKRSRRIQIEPPTSDEDEDSQEEIQDVGDGMNEDSSNSADEYEHSRKVSRSRAKDRGRRGRRRASKRTGRTGKTTERTRSWTDTTADEAHQTEPSLRPVVMADDEEARQILQPMIRHTIQKLDDLLMGLHHSRQNHVDPDDYDSDSVTDTPASRESSVATEGSMSKGRSHSRVRQSRSTTRYRRRRRSRQGMTRLLSELRPRDWSEVLGIATMTGWHTDVVERTAARCSELFGEGMGFHKEKNGSTDRSEDEDEVTSGDEMHGGVHVDGFMKPIRARRVKDVEASDDGSTASETEPHVEEQESNVFP